MSDEQVRRALKDAYLIEFPDDLFQFWEFTQGFNADNPLTVFSEPMGILLEGPFNILAGRFDKQPPAGWYLGTRYYDDPPEFFMVFSGDTDGLHWGYWFDDPDNSPACCVADYYSRDAYEMTEDGRTLFDAFRFHLEGCHSSTLENIEYDPNAEQSMAKYQADLETYAAIRTRLMQFATADRPEVGNDYVERYADGEGERNVLAETFDGMGIVVPENLYRPLSVNGEELRKLAVADADLSTVVAEAQSALAEGFPGTALELGKNLWIGDPAQKQEAYHLLDGAYAALNRPTLGALLAKIIPTRTE